MEPTLIFEQRADFVEYVRRLVERKYGSDALYKQGLRIYTSVDLNLTKAARDSMDSGLRELDKREGYRGPVKTLNVKGVLEFLEEKSKNMQEPLKYGDITEGVITHLDHENVYVRLGTYEKDGVKKEYFGQIKIDSDPKWWIRQPYIRPEQRTRNFAPGEAPFQVGDLIEVKILDPNPKRRELYMKKFGKTDPEMKNYKEYSEEISPYFLLAPEQEPVVQSALMLRENRTGYVRVLMGGYSSSESKYNRAIQSRRQAGSSFKPVIYAAALDKGFTASDIIMDSPLALTVPGTGEVWRPKNYRGGFAGTCDFPGLSCQIQKYSNNKNSPADRDRLRQELRQEAGIHINAYGKPYYGPGFYRCVPGGTTAGVFGVSQQRLSRSSYLCDKNSRSPWKGS